MVEQVNKLLQAVNTMTGGATNLPSSIGIPPLNTGTFSAELPLVSNLNFGVTYKPNQRIGLFQVICSGSAGELTMLWTSISLRRL